MKRKTKLFLFVCFSYCIILNVILLKDYLTSNCNWFCQKDCKFFPTCTSSETNIKQRILIVSYFRSGSSWLGELLSRTPNSFYVFEPLHLYELEKTSREELHRGYKVPRLEELFHCSISHQFLLHLKIWYALYQALNCEKGGCTTKIITEQCVSANFIIIKTVRLLLSEVENILIKPSFRDTKIIYLVRDPRGVMNSLINMEAEMRERVKIGCSKIREDIQVYPTLKSIYQDNIFFVRYEDLARKPYEKASEIWSFINNKESQEIPQQWKIYLNESSVRKAENEIGSYDINAKSTKAWQNWRLNITEDLLRFAEEDCYDVIETLGYNILGDIRYARDLNYSVLDKKYCSTVPCEEN